MIAQFVREISKITIPISFYKYLKIYETFSIYGVLHIFQKLLNPCLIFFYHSLITLELLSNLFLCQTDFSNF